MKKTISPNDLNTIIMSVVHDVKNSLLVSSSTLENLNSECSQEQQLQINSIQNEIKGVNQSLMRMLSLYKMQTDVFSLRCDQYNVYDMLEELVLTNSSSISNKDLSFEIQCEYDTEWFLDYELISNVINSMINNTLRYAKSKIILKAFIVNNLLALSVEDDGKGYPKSMLDNSQQLTTEINFNVGNSGLGLFFAETIAKLHEFKDVQGYTEIKNLKSGGGCFTIYLP